MPWLSTSFTPSLPKPALVGLALLASRVAVASPNEVGAAAREAVDTGERRAVTITYQSRLYSNAHPNIADVQALPVWIGAGIGDGTVVGLVSTGAFLNQFLGTRCVGGVNDGISCSTALLETACTNQGGSCLGGPITGADGSPLFHDATDPTHTAPSDDHGIGTFLTGVAASPWGYGVAPGARWIACKAVDAALASNPSAVIECLEWLLNPDGRKDAQGNDDPVPEHVPNVILIGPLPPGQLGVCDDTLRPTILRLRAMGILPVFSVGDDPNGADVSGTPDILGSPANFPESFTVAGAIWNQPGPPLLPRSYHGTAACVRACTCGEPGCDCTSGDCACGAPGCPAGSCLAPRSAPRLRAPGTNVLGPATTGPLDVVAREGSDVGAAHVAGAAALLYGAYRTPYAGVLSPEAFVETIEDVLARAACPRPDCPAGVRCPPISCAPGAPGYLDVYAAATFEDAIVVDETPFKDDDHDGMEDLNLDHVLNTTRPVHDKTITMRNTGILTWEPAVHFLSFIDPIDTFSWTYRDPVTGTETPRSRIPLTRSVPPGDSYTFAFDPGITFAMDPRVLLFQWRMIDDSGVLFGESSTPRWVTVVSPGGPVSTTTTVPPATTTSTIRIPIRRSTTTTTVPCATRDASGLRCVLVTEFPPPVCAPDQLPRAFGRQVDAARRLLDKLDATDEPRKLKRLVEKFVRHLLRARAALRHARKRHPSPACMAATSAVLDEAILRAGQLYTP